MKRTKGEQTKTDRRSAKSRNSGLEAPQAYAHSPLVETAFEIRFSGEPAIECHRDRYFAKIRNEFPTVWVPNAEAGKPLALQPYHFRSSDESETVMLALNRFTYTTKQYPGFTRFAPRALGLATSFCREFKLDRLTRTGLRYINVIPFLRENGAIPWKRYFTVDLTLPAASPDEYLNASLAIESRVKEGAITTRIACGKAAEGGREVFLLDFDFAKTDKLVANRLAEYMAESHDHTKKVFEGIVSDSYKAVMRGEVII